MEEEVVEYGVPVCHGYEGEDVLYKDDHETLVIHESLQTPLTVELRDEWVKPNNQLDEVASMVVDQSGKDDDVAVKDELEETIYVRCTRHDSFVPEGIGFQIPTPPTTEPLDFIQASAEVQVVTHMAEQTTYSGHEEFGFNCVKLNCLMLSSVDTTSVVSEETGQKLQLKKDRHPELNKPSRVNGDKEVTVNRRCLISLSMNRDFLDKIGCDVVSTDGYHALLSRPWLYDRTVIRNGRKGNYLFLSLHREGSSVRTISHGNVLSIFEHEMVAYALLPFDSGSAEENADLLADVQTRMSGFAGVIPEEILLDRLSTKSVPYQVNVVPGSSIPSKSVCRLTPTPTPSVRPHFGLELDRPAWVRPRLGSTSLQIMGTDLSLTDIGFDLGIVWLRLGCDLGVGTKYHLLQRQVMGLIKKCYIRKGMSSCAMTSLSVLKEESVISLVTSGSDSFIGTTEVEPCSADKGHKMGFTIRPMVTQVQDLKEVIYLMNMKVCKDIKRFISIILKRPQTFLPSTDVSKDDHIAHQYDQKIDRLLVPQSITSDRDIQLISQFWESAWKEIGTKSNFNRSYHSLTDGLTKVINRSLIILLRCLEELKQEQRDLTPPQTELDQVIMDYLLWARVGVDALCVRMGSIIPRIMLTVIQKKCNAKNKGRTDNHLCQISFAMRNIISMVLVTTDLEWQIAWGLYFGDHNVDDVNSRTSSFQLGETDAGTSEPMMQRPKFTSVTLRPTSLRSSTGKIWVQFGFWPVWVYLGFGRLSSLSPSA